MSGQSSHGGKGANDNNGEMVVKIASYRRPGQLPLGNARKVGIPVVAPGRLVSMGRRWRRGGWGKGRGGERGESGRLSPCTEEGEEVWAVIRCRCCRYRYCLASLEGGWAVEGVGRELS